MFKKPLIMVPGPTLVPERVQQAMHRQVINHRGPEYEALFRTVSEKLKAVFKTKCDVLTYPSAGTGMMEACIANFLSAGDKILVVSIGVFGDRFAEIAKQFNVKVEKLDFTWGKAANEEELKKYLVKDTEHEIKAIFMTHNETSTGVTNDIKKLAAVCKNHPALIVVDAVSSLGAINLEMDNWGLDVVITGSQKALMIPPGLGFMAVSAKAWKFYEKSTLPKYYWDAGRVKKSLDKYQNPYTPPVTLLFGLAESLKLIEEEGLENIFARHCYLRNALRAGVKALGLELLADDNAASPAVTAIKVSQGLEAKKIQKHIRDVYGITIAGGQKQLENKIFRIGHLGWVNEGDIIAVLAALEKTLADLKMDIKVGAAVTAAQKMLMEERK